MTEHSDADETGQYVPEASQAPGPLGAPEAQPDPTAAGADPADDPALQAGGQARPGPSTAQETAPPPEAPGAEAVLRAVAEGLAERFAAAAGEMLQAPFHARLASVTPQTAGEFLAGVLAPTCCYALVSSRSEGEEQPAAAPAGWLEMSPAFAFVCLDRLLGGRIERAYLPDRPLTAVERRLLRRVLALAATSLSGVWPAKPGPRFRLADGWGCRPGGGDGRQQPAVTARFELALATQVGMMRLCLPASAMAGLKVPARLTPARNAGPMLLRVAVSDIFVQADQLAALAPDDIITTDTPVDAEVVVRLAGIPKFAARLGSSDGKRAVTLTRKLDSLSAPTDAAS